MNTSTSVQQHGIYQRLGVTEHTAYCSKGWMVDANKGLLSYSAGVTDVEGWPVILFRKEA